MVLFALAWQSLKNRRLTTALTVVSIALSIALLVGVENVRVGARESFANTISQTDLIVGARGGSLQLLLYSVFRLGSATNNLKYDSYLAFKNHPAVAWTIPYSLGDGHRGFRVVGTTEDFYRHYRYRRDRSVTFAAGRLPGNAMEVALGSEVAEKLGYQLGGRIAVTHGLGAGRGILDHDDQPFTVVGILARTATPVDRSLYVPLEGIAAMHEEFEAHSAPQTHENDTKTVQITAFLLRSKSRISTLRLQREVNTFAAEPLQAIIPAVALGELWQTIGYAEDALRIVTLFVIGVGLLGMLVSLYTSLNERRREMAVLRAIGAGPATIVGLLVLESGLLSALSAALGVALVYTLSFAAQPVIEQRFGLALPIQALTATSYAYLGAVLLAGVLVGVVPAVKAYRNTLADGLSVRL